MARASAATYHRDGSLFPPVRPGMGGSATNGPPPNVPPGIGVPGGSIMTGPDGTGPTGGMVKAGPGIGNVPGAADDEPAEPGAGVSLIAPLGMTLGKSKAAAGVTSGAWARTVVTGRPSAAAGEPSRALGVPSWANAPGERTKEQPRPIRIRFIDPPSGQ